MRAFFISAFTVLSFLSVHGQVLRPHLMENLGTSAGSLITLPTSDQLVCGIFDSPLLLGDTTLLPQGFDNDVFIGLMGPEASWTWTASVSSSGYDAGRIEMTPNGKLILTVQTSSPDALYGSLPLGNAGSGVHLLEIGPASGELLGSNFLTSSPWVAMNGIWINDSTAICRTFLESGEFIGPIVNTGTYPTDVLFRYNSDQGIVWHSLLQGDEMSSIVDLELLSSGNFVATISSGSATSISIFGEQYDLPAPEPGWSHGGIICFNPNGEVVWDLFPESSSQSTFSQMNLEVIDDLNMVIYGRSFGILTVNGQDLPQADNFRLYIDTAGVILDHQILNSNLIWLGNAVPLDDDRTLIQGYFEEPPILDTLDLPYVLPGIVIAEISDSGNWNWAYALSGQNLVARLSKGPDNSIYLKTQCFGPLEIPGLVLPNAPYTNTHIFKLSEECLSVIAQATAPSSCEALGSGAAQAYVLGGTPPFSYSWSNGSTVENLAGVPSGVHEVIVTDSGGCSDTSQVYVSGPPDESGFDLMPFANSYPFFRPGMPTELLSAMYNLGCQPATGMLEISLDPLVEYVSGLGPNDEQNGNLLLLSMENIVFPSPVYRQLILETNASAQIGDTVCLNFTASSTSIDLVPENDHMEICYPIVNSYDPNDKRVFPAGTGPQGITPADTRLTYMIRFQNTGNAPAFNVFIDDTLDIDLDLMGLHLIGSSHPMELQILQDRVLRFRFDNINLPDSSSDEANSHGYVSYSVPMISDLAPGTQIENTAYIYFDLNPPVITNTTLNTIDPFTSISDRSDGSELLVAWPNPLYDQLQLVIPTSVIGRSITVFDLQGRSIWSTDKAGSNMVLRTHDWANGTYIIKAGSYTTRVVKCL